jgi:hypothetical protein
MEMTEFAVFEKNETLLESIVADTFTFCMVGFAVYISKDSTWWTFVTGLMFLLFVFGKISILLRKQNRFKTKADLLDWANKLPDA